MPVIALIQFCTYLVSIIPPRGSVRVRVSSYPNINRGTYVPATGTRCRGCRGKRRGLRGKAAGHAASRGKAASCRGKAAYNLVKYYLAFAFKLFYYVFFDL